MAKNQKKSKTGKARSLASKKKTKSRNSRKVSRKTKNKTKSNRTKNYKRESKREKEERASNDVDISDIISESAKLLSLGVSERDIREVMKDTGMPDSEIDRIIKSAREIYTPATHSRGKEPTEYYEPNGWLMLITVVFLIILSIILTIILI